MDSPISKPHPRFSGQLSTRERASLGFESSATTNDALATIPYALQACRPSGEMPDRERISAENELGAREQEGTERSMLLPRPPWPRERCPFAGAAYSPSSAEPTEPDPATAPAQPLLRYRRHGAGSRPSGHESDMAWLGDQDHESKEDRNQESNINPESR